MKIANSSLLRALALLAATSGSHAYDPNKVISIGIILFPGFQPLDVIGPLDIIQGLSGRQNMTLSLIWKTTGPVTAKSPPSVNIPSAIYPRQAPSLVATHTFSTAPDLDILLVPGGGGNRFLAETNDMAIEDFVRERYPQLTYLLSVCSGAASLARAGVLSGKRATTNKAAWAWVTQFGEGQVNWVPNARWTEDGNIWTSSGVSAGIDMTYAFFTMLLGANVVQGIINGIEYSPHLNKEWDPYAVVHKVPGADLSRSLGDCVGPVGYEFDCAGGKK